jgi:ABC-2 type transport system ATP-binding protein
LLHLLNGFLFPKEGIIDVEGQHPRHRAVSFLERVAYVPVEVELPAIRVSAYEQRLAGFYPKFDQNLWKKALDMFQIDPKTKIDALSFGQKKKVAISFALATQSDILLLDEPTDGLDIPSKDSFRRLLSTHVNENRIVVITTHHVHDIATLLDHVVILQDTRLAANVSVATLTERMYSFTTTQLPPADELLYSERVPGGYHCLVRQRDGGEGPLDLELLFKAFLLHPQILSF